MRQKFTLTIDDKIYLDLDITKLLLIQSINKIKNGESEFMILAPNTSLMTSEYMQLISNFVIEIHVVSSAGETSHYQYITDDFEEVKLFFCNYFEKNSFPDIDNNWRNITKSLQPSLLTKIFKRKNKKW